MSKIIQIELLATGTRSEFEGMYVQSVDFEADMTLPNAVLGWFTEDIDKAKRFKDLGEALEYWKTERKRDGLRPDGKPNRPLTAFTISIINGPD